MIKRGLKWGVILGISLIVGTQILTWLGLGTSPWYIVMTYILVIIAALLSARDQKNADTERFNYLRSFLNVLIVIVVSRYFFQTYMYFYINFIDPTWIETVSENWSKMLQERNHSEEQIVNQISRFKKAYQLLNMFTTEIVFKGVSQFVLGCLISGFYLRRRKSI